MPASYAVPPPGRKCAFGWEGWSGAASPAPRGAYPAPRRAPQKLPVAPPSFSDRGSIRRVGPQKGRSAPQRGSRRPQKGAMRPLLGGSSPKRARSPPFWADRPPGGGHRALLWGRRAQRRDVATPERGGTALREGGFKEPGPESAVERSRQRSEIRPWRSSRRCGHPAAPGGCPACCLRLPGIRGGKMGLAPGTTFLKFVPRFLRRACG